MPQVDYAQVHKRLSAITTSIAEITGHVNSGLQHRERLQKQLSEKKQALHKLNNKLDLFGETIGFLNILIDKTRIETYAKIAAIVNFGLQEIYGDGFEFKIQTDTHGNNPVCKFYLKTPQYPVWSELTRADESHGGGIQEIIGFLLQVVVHIIIGCTFKTFIMDERFRQVSVDYVYKLIDLIKQLNEMFGLQFILISHDPAFINNADKVIQLGTQESHGTSNS